MNVDDAHADALPAFTAAGFWYEDFLGVFMFSWPDGRTLTCAYDWEGSGAWSAQLHGADGEDLGGADFATVEQVIKYRDAIK